MFNIECSPSCNTGLRECFSINDGDCCSAVENNVCVSNCPAPGRPQASASYTCSKNVVITKVVYRGYSKIISLTEGK